MQSTLHLRAPEGLHAGIIMDGNGRWAEARGMSRSRGHAAGARAARRIVHAAPDFGIGVLTLYAFSADNWKRPPVEVRSLMRLMRAYLRAEADRCTENGIRLEVIGRRDRLPPIVVREIVATEGRTARGGRLLLRMAIDYSARDSIVAAALARPDSRREFRFHLDRACHARTSAPDVDLLVRTGGERRLSDFQLWECAYAELLFTDVAWPDFGPDDLERAVRDFRARERRFGGLPGPAARDLSSDRDAPSGPVDRAPSTRPAQPAHLAHQAWR